MKTFPRAVSGINLLWPSGRTIFKWTFTCGNCSASFRTKFTTSPVIGVVCPHCQAVNRFHAESTQ